MGYESITDSATDDTKLPLAGGAMTGAITTNSTFDGRDVAADGVTADAALPKAGGTVTGTVTMGDDVKLVFGAGTDASLEYDENGTDQLRIAGSAIFEDQVQLDKSILVDSAPANNVFSGITGLFTAGEDLSVGECVYLKASDTKMWKAVSVVSGTGLITPDIMCVAVAAETMSANDTNKTFLLQGFLTSTAFPTYAIGETLYLPEAEQSSLNVPHGTVPSTDGDFIQVVGWASAANTIFFNPSYTIIEIA